MRELHPPPVYRPCRPENLEIKPQSIGNQKYKYVEVVEQRTKNAIQKPMGRCAAKINQHGQYKGFECSQRTVTGPLTVTVLSWPV